MRFFILLSLVLSVVSGGAQSTRNWQSSFAGTVRQIDGAAGERQVVAYQMMVQDGVARPVARCSTNTKPDGSYLCGPIPAGRYLIMTRAVPVLPETIVSKSATAPTPMRLIDPITFYPSAGNPGDAELIQVREGEQGSADIILNPKTPAMVKGTVMGRPAGVVLTLLFHTPFFDLPTLFPMHYQTETGRFTSEPIPPGEYLLKADWFAEGKEHHSVARVLASAEPGKELVLREEEAAKISGVVRLEEGVTAPLPAVLLLECGAWGSRVRYEAKLTAAGAFSFGAVPPATCSLSLKDDAGLSLSAVRMKGVELPLEKVVATPSGSVRLDVELSDKRGSVAGVLTGEDRGKPGTGIVARSLVTGRTLVVHPDAAGAFRFDGLACGRYELYAWTDVASAAYNDPGYLRLFERDRVEVEVKTGETAQVEIRAVSVGASEGKLFSQLTN